MMLSLIPNKKKWYTGKMVNFPVVFKTVFDTSRNRNIWERTLGDVHMSTKFQADILKKLRFTIWMSRTLPTMFMRLAAFSGFSHFARFVPLTMYSRVCFSRSYRKTVLTTYHITQIWNLKFNFSDLATSDGLSLTQGHQRKVIYVSTTYASVQTTVGSQLTVDRRGQWQHGEGVTLP